MSYHEEEKTRLRRQSSKQAIQLAMEGRWREAVEINKGVLESFPNDIDAHNRLGRAYLELGEYALSRDAYQKTLDLDPYNIIAKKNLTRLAHLEQTPAAPAEAEVHKVEPQQFIEEVGKAGVVSLNRLGEAAVLAKAVAGDPVNLKINEHNLIAENMRGEYLGQLDARHGQRLIKLMEGGNRYSAAIVSSQEDGVTIIVREIYQDPSQAGRLSFPPNREAESFRPYVVERAIRRELEFEEPTEPGMAVVGEEGELLPEETIEPEAEEEIEEE